MTTPSTADIKKRETTLAGFLKQIDPVTGKAKEKQAIQVVRSAIRQAWMKSPTKLAYLYSKTIPDMDDSTRTKWLVECECCGNRFKQTDVEIDHIKGCNPFSELRHFEEYFQSILMVGFDDLQILCKDCHATKTLQDKLGITFEEAVVEKQVIAICKNKADHQHKWLTDRGVIPEKSAAKRRIQIRDVIRNLS